MKTSFSIGNKEIGEGNAAYIIAEIGSNHDQDIGQAKALIDAAAEAGVDAAKFQLFKAEDLRQERDEIFDTIKSVEFPREWIEEISGYTRDKGLAFLAAPFDEEAVDLLDRYDAPAFKMASSEIANFSLLQHVAKKKKPIILSTGMSDLADVHDALQVIEEAGNDEVVLLHCVALYPTPPDKLNLRVMDTLRTAFQIPVGFSDHTLGILFPSVAVARGACAIEKHLTPDRSLPGPDHSYAIEPPELIEMVKNIRDIEVGLGRST